MPAKILKKLKEKFIYPGREALAVNNSNGLLTERLVVLRERGYIILENFISEESLKLLKKSIKEELEDKVQFETPCIAQTKIDEIRHQNIIQNYFRYTPLELEKFGITFGKSEVKSFSQVLEDYKPSTLKLYLPKESNFLNLWLHPELLEIVEAYMGLKPFLQEAYIRRNFPAKYRVMNHFWHRDTNHPDYLIKIFLFFTDCKLENGPHEYIAESIVDRRLDGKPYYSDEEVNQLYPVNSENRIRSIVKAGTVVVEDTRGLHRAMIPEAGYRDLGYAVFMPQAFYHRWESKYYEVKRQDFDALNKYQQAYIPKKFIK